MRKTRISGSLVVLTLCGCTALSPELPEEAPSGPAETFTTAKEDTSSAVSSSNAQSVAARFLGRPLSRAAAAGEYAVTDAKGDTTLRIINFSEGGFVIVSGKKDYYPVLAHSETGSFDPKLMQTTGASLWIETNSFIVGNAEALTDSVKTAARKEWNRYVYESVPYESSVSSRSESDVYQMMYDQVQQWKNEGYTVMTLGDFKNSSEFQSLEEYCPVYMRGESNSSAHAWVCDGVTTSNWRTEYELWGLEDCPESYEPQMFINIYNYTGPTYSSEASFHYNWGYEGMGDGNFLD